MIVRRAETGIFLAAQFTWTADGQAIIRCRIAGFARNCRSRRRSRDHHADAFRLLHGLPILHTRSGLTKKW